MPKNAETRKKAFEALGIPEGNKVLICMDGGGVRGILTLQLLKGLERQAGIPCYELADMVAGTSTGGIIAGLMAMQKSAEEIEKLYIQLVTKVFKKRSWAASQYLNPPKYDKVNYRAVLKGLLANTTLKQACEGAGLDLMITSKDIAAGEETFFSCFNNVADDHAGAYKDVLLRAVLEATMSAPTYFRPFERFLDGGVTTYNNPALAAIMEAVDYGPKGRYSLDKLSVFSFGTGISPLFEKADNTGNPSGIDIMFWLNYVMEEAGNDASAMQIDTIRNTLCGLGLDFRRFQISFDESAIRQLPDKDLTAIHYTAANSLWEMSNKDLGEVDLDDISKFDLLRVMGTAMDEYIMGPKGNQYKADLINARKRDSLVTARGDVDIIKSNMSNPGWVDTQPSA